MPSFLQLVICRQRLRTQGSMILEPKPLTNLPTIKIDYCNFRTAYFYLKKKRELLCRVRILTWINGGTWGRLWVLWIVWAILASLPLCSNSSPLPLSYRLFFFVFRTLSMVSQWNRSLLLNTPSPSLPGISLKLESRKCP